MGLPEPLLSGSYKNHTVLPTCRAGRTVNRRRIAFKQGSAGTVKFRAECLADHLTMPVTEEELLAAELVAEGRPQPLRDFDQISMHAGDLLRQVKLAQPLLAGKRVAFMGDNDGAALLFGLLGCLGQVQLGRMLVLDFDKRILARAAALAERHGFRHYLDVRAYNAFDLVPAELLGRFDVFYTNPPYGSHNNGASGRLFITRGVELCHSEGGASGCIILPDDTERSWTRNAMHATQSFLLKHGWAIGGKINRLHRYHLEEDPGLTSSTLWVSSINPEAGMTPLPDAGQRVSLDSIAHFYGRKTMPPYPRYIREDGVPEYIW